MAFENPTSGLAAQLGARKGPARTNYFAVSFAGPANIGVPDNAVINALCESVQLPGRSISTFEHGTTRQATKRPYGFINDDITMTFIVTNDFYIKNLWDAWMRAVVDDVTGKIGYKDNYAQDVTISVLDLNGLKMYETKLTNAFPINIAAIELSNASENELMKMTVTLTYDNFTTKTHDFGFVTSVADFNAALSIPSPGLSSIPFSPFGDIPNQIQFTTAADLGDALRGTLDGALNQITNSITGGIQETITSITRPVTNAINSVANQIFGGFNSIVGAAVGGVTGIINNITSNITGAIGSVINNPIASITGVLNSGISSISNRISSGIKGLFG